MRLLKKGVIFVMAVAVFTATAATIAGAGFLVQALNNTNESGFQSLIESIQNCGINNLESEGLYWAAVHVPLNQEILTTKFRQAGFQKDKLTTGAEFTTLSGTDPESGIRGSLTWYHQRDKDEDKDKDKYNDDDNKYNDVDNDTEYLKLQLSGAGMEQIKQLNSGLNRASGALLDITHHPIKTWTIQGSITEKLTPEQMSALAAKLMEQEKGNIKDELVHDGSLNLLGQVPGLPAGAEVNGDEVNINLAFKVDTNRDNTSFYAGFPFLTNPY